MKEDPDVSLPAAIRIRGGAKNITLIDNQTYGMTLLDADGDVEGLVAQGNRSYIDPNPQGSQNDKTGRFRRFIKHPLAIAVFAAITGKL